MAIHTNETLEEISIRVDGDLDLTSVPSFQAAAAKASEMRGERRLVIDLTGTDYIDSAGLEQLLIVNRKLMAQGERLKVNVTDGSQPQTVLTITGFSAVMDVTP
jgi:anti-anti-sigma factor